MIIVIMVERLTTASDNELVIVTIVDNSGYSDHLTKVIIAIAS